MSFPGGPSVLSQPAGPPTSPLHAAQQRSVHPAVPFARLSTSHAPVSLRLGLGSAGAGLEPRHPEHTCCRAGSLCHGSGLSWATFLRARKARGVTITFVHPGLRFLGTPTGTLVHSVPEPISPALALVTPETRPPDPVAPGENVGKQSWCPAGHRVPVSRERWNSPYASSSFSVFSRSPVPCDSGVPGSPASLKGRLW